MESLSQERQEFAIRLQEVQIAIATSSAELVEAQGKVEAAEAKAVELWSTVTEIQGLHQDLELALDDKRDAVHRVSSELEEKLAQRETLLAELSSAQVALSELNAQSETRRESKEALERQLIALTAEREQLEDEIAKSNSEFVTLQEKIELANLALLEVSAQLTNAEKEARASASMEPATETVAAAAEIAIEIPAVSEQVIDIGDDRTDQAPLSLEEDVWASLGELARMNDSLRVDRVEREALSGAGQYVPQPPTGAARASSTSKVDEWELVFSPR